MSAAVEWQPWMDVGTAKARRMGDRQWAGVQAKADGCPPLYPSCATPRNSRFRANGLMDRRLHQDDCRCPAPLPTSC
jgi:hypothetical protein